MGRKIFKITKVVMLMVQIENNNRSTPKKIKLAFILFTNLRVGAGTETTLFNYINSAPNDLFDVTVVQTDYIENPRLSQEYVREKLSNIKLIEWPDYKNKFRFLEKNYFTELLLRVLIEPLLMFLSYHLVYKNLANQFKDFDIIYLYSNPFSKFFNKSKALVIGTSHTGLSIDHSFLGRISTRLIQERLRFRNIDGYHLFPYHSKIFHSFKSRSNFILSNGVDTELYHPPEQRDINQPLRFIFVGRLEACKGITRLLEAWEVSLSKSDAELHIVGDGSLRELVSSKANGNVIYHGRVDLDQLGKLYRQSDILVHPSKCDTLTLVVLEAASSGLFVLESKWLQGTYDDLSDLGFLEYIDPSSNGISEKLLECLNMRQRIVANKNLVSKYIQNTYDWKIIAGKFFEELSKLFVSSHSSDVLIS